jgi:uncharacterized protein
MEQRLNMLMLGVDDLERSRRFYESGLGWKPWGARRSKTSVKYLAGGVVIAMIDRGYVANEAALPQGSGTIGIVPVINVSGREQVDRAAEEVASAGGVLTSPPRQRDGGLYSFYFADPDGNPWEVVWNPNMQMDERGVLQSSD